MILQRLIIAYFALGYGTMWVAVGYFYINDLKNRLSWSARIIGGLLIGCLWPMVIYRAVKKLPRFIHQGYIEFINFKNEE